MKKKRKINIRVEVTPYSIYQGEDSLYKSNRDLIEQIKRHCDFDTISDNFEVEEYCSFCNTIWESDDQGVPFCCEEAQNEWCKENNMVYNEKEDKFVAVEDNLIPTDPERSKE